jgi:hypothetical protein
VIQVVRLESAETVREGMVWYCKKDWFISVFSFFYLLHPRHGGGIVPENQKPIAMPLMNL